MEITSFFPNSDNIYKFTFLTGVLMVVFSFVYPLEKQQKLELEVNIYNQQIDLLNNEISSLYSAVKKANSHVKLIIKDANSFKKSGVDLPDTKLNSEISELNVMYKKLSEQEMALNIKNVILKYEKEKISILEKHINEFSIFRWILLGLGSIFIFYGGWNWRNATLVSENLQKLELTKKQAEAEKKS